MVILRITEVTKSNAMGGGRNGDDDELEDNIISHIVEKHFEYIANHFLISKDSSNVNDIHDIDDDGELESVARAGEGGKKYVLPHTALMTGAEASARHNACMRKKKETMQKALYWKRLRDVSMNIAGHALGCYLTFTLSSAVQNYMQSLKIS
jgi:hypothetical protein